MKLELIKKVEIDSIYYTIEKDNWPIMVFRVGSENEQDVLKKAEAYFQKAMKPIIVETLKSIEI